MSDHDPNDPEVTPPETPRVRKNGHATAQPQATGMTGLVAAVNGVAKTEKWILALNVAVMVAVLGLVGAFAAWVLTGSKAYAQNVGAEAQTADKKTNERIDRFETRYENDRADQAVQNAKMIERLDKIYLKISDGGGK